MPAIKPRVKIRKAFGRTFSADFQSVVFSTELEVEVPEDMPEDQVESHVRKQVEIATKAGVIVQRRIAKLLDEDVEEALDDQDLRELIYGAQDRLRHD